MEIKQILAILNDKNTVSKEQKKLLKRWRDVYYGISLHTTGACPRFKDLRTGQFIEPPSYFGVEYQRLFDQFHFSRHPREMEEQRMWRYSQYRPLTRAPFQQLTDIVIGAIFQDSNYNIELENDEDRKYIWGNNFDGYDLIGWYANIGYPSMVEDPNGIIVRMPTRPFYEQQSKVNIELVFVNSKDILYRDEYNLVFRYKGYAFWINDRVIFRFTENQKGEYFLNGEDSRGYYAHMFGRLPIDIAGGVWNTQGFFDSYYSKAKPIADEYISTYSAEQLIDKEASHPFITLTNEKCTECDGVGKIQNIVDNAVIGLINCHACEGHGRVASQNPGERLYAPADQMDKDLIKITNPDTGINKYHHDKNNDVFKRLLDALNLLIVEEGQSGAAKAIDKEQLYQFISKIANHLFDKHIYNALTDIIAYRNVVAIDGVVMPSVYSFSVTKPTQYQISTAADLIENYKSTKDAGMPVFLRNKAVQDYVDKQYSGDNIMKRKAELILELDKTAVFTPDEKLTQKTIGAFTLDDLQYSDNLPMLLDGIIRDKGERYFLNATYEQIKQEVEIISPKAQPLFNTFDEGAFNE